MAAPVDTLDVEDHLATIDAFRALIVRLGLERHPVHSSVATATVFAQLAQAVDDRHRQAARDALAALARNETDRAVAILRSISEGER